MLQIQNLHKTFNPYTPYEHTIFNDFNLKIEKNKSTAIIGSNGCGKSTLMNLIAGSLKPDAGEIHLNDKNISKLSEEQRAKYIGRVYQNPSLGVAPSLTILENMALADKKGEKIGLKKLLRKNRIPYYLELLKTLDLGLELHPETGVQFLSGGQRQSLSLLMATMKQPDLLLLDEHTAALDPKTSHVIMQKTKELLTKHQMTTLMITHDMNAAVEFADRIIMLENGKIVLDEKTNQISEKELHAIYRNKITSHIIQDIAS